MALRPLRRMLAAGALGAQAEPEALAIFGRMTTPPDSNRKSLINSLIAGAKARGLMFVPGAPIHVFHMLAAHEAQAARLDWINQHGDGRYNATAVAGANFTIDRGYASDGAASYVDTGFNPGTAGESWHTQNDASFFFRNNLDNTNSLSLAGFFDVSSGVTVNPRTATGNNEATVRMHQAAPTTSAASVAPSSIGLYTAVREGANVAKLYRNKALVITSADASTPLTTGGAYRLGATSNTSFRVGQFACSGVGSKLTQQNINDLNDLLAPYFAALGIT